jgi:hypothetical protein
VLSLIGAIFLGGILVIATFGKVLDPILLVQEIRNEGLDIVLSANSVTLIALALEMGLGMALLLGMRNLIVLIPSSLLVAFFLFLTGKNFWLVVTGQRDNSSDCGCFGVFMERTATEAFWQDLLLLVPALVLSFLDRKALHAALSRWKTVVSLLSAAAVVLYTVFVVGMPAELASVEDEGVEISENQFTVSNQFVVVVDGELDQGAEVFEAPATLEFLVLLSDFDEALILDVKSSSCSTFDRAAVLRLSDTAVEFGGGVDAVRQGSFSVGGEGLSLGLGGHEIQLRAP